VTAPDETRPDEPRPGEPRPDDAPTDIAQQDLAERVAALEKTVAELERRLGASSASGASVSSPRPAPTPAPASASTPATAAATPMPNPVPRPPTARVDPSVVFTRPTLPVLSADPGQWVNRLGIALLLFGAAFGFKYSIDRGWIGPAVRVLFGLSLGAVLLLVSGRVRDARPGLSRVLAGGGIACGYLSIYAAFHLYLLISHGAA
jgi:uncharacterized membrane protein